MYPMSSEISKLLGDTLCTFTFMHCSGSSKPSIQLTNKPATYHAHTHTHLVDANGSTIDFLVVYRNLRQQKRCETA